MTGSIKIPILDLMDEITQYAAKAKQYNDAINKIITKCFDDRFQFGWLATHTIINGIVYVSCIGGVYILYSCGTLRWINNESYTKEELERL